MNTIPRRVIRGLACGAALLCVGLWAPVGQADEPPTDFPPATQETPPPAKPPAATPPASTQPASGAPGTWSAPAVTPGPDQGTAALPPPQIIRHGSRPTSGSPLPLGPTVTGVPDGRSTASPPAALPPSSMPPSSMPPATMPPATMPPATMPPASMPPASMPPASMPPASMPQAAGAGTRVISIRKQHNVEIPGVGAAGSLGRKDLALRLDVGYEVHGQAGRDVYVAVWFARLDSGALIRSAMPEYADASGQVTLQTRAARVAGNAARFVATLRVPYRAFPVASGEDAYDVQARVQVLRQEGPGRVSVLARGSTSFRVYGAPETPALAPAPAATPSAPAAQPSAPAPAQPSAQAPAQPPASNIVEVPLKSSDDEAGDVPPEGR